MNQNSKYPLVRKPMPNDKRFVDKTGVRFGRLTVTGYVGTQGERRMWEATCDCGNTTCVASSSLVQGSTQSCGCLRRELSAARVYKHGGKGTSLYTTWKCMRGRCRNPMDASFPDYGARGITISPAFDEFADFKEYVDTHMGQRPSSKHSLDRMDNEKGYEPGNLRWSTWTQQASNRRSNRKVTLCGEEMTLTEASKIFGIPDRAVRARVDRLGWTAADALTTPIGKKPPPPTIVVRA